jgi:hypothetical protein
MCSAVAPIVSLWLHFWHRVGFIVAVAVVAVVVVIVIVVAVMSYTSCPGCTCYRSASINLNARSCLVDVLAMLIIMLCSSSECGLFFSLLLISPLLHFVLLLFRAPTAVGTCVLKAYQ